MLTQDEHRRKAAITTTALGEVLAENVTLTATVAALKACLNHIQRVGKLQHREDPFEVCYDWCPSCRLESTLKETTLGDDILAQLAEARKDKRDVALWLRHYLETASEHRPVKDERGYVVNSFTGVVIPDWHVKQKLDILENSAISQTESKQENTK